MAYLLFFMNYGKLWVHLTKPPPKIRYQLAHLGNNKQSFQLGLAVFYEATIAVRNNFATQLTVLGEGLSRGGCTYTSSSLDKKF